MTTKLVTKASLELRIRDLIAGTQKHPPTGPVSIDGVSYTAASLVQLLQSLADAIAAVTVAKASGQNAVTNMRVVQTQVLPVIRGYSNLLVTSNGNAPALLADYGLTPRKVRAPLTAEQQVLTNAKIAATRAARHTMGSKQKKAIKGTVPATTPTTPTTAAPPTVPTTAPATPPAPAAAHPTTPT